MCSLFPVMMASVETTSLQGNTNKHGISANSAGSIDSHRDDEEPASTIGSPSSPESKNTSNDHHSDHDSLLPPVGTASTTTISTRLEVEEGMCVDKPEISVTKAIPFSPPKQQQHCPRIAKVLPRPVTNGNADRAFPQMLPSSSDSQPNSLLSHRKHSEKTIDTNNIHDHDDDCNYDGPLIGVLGDDEASGLVSRSSCTNYHDFHNGGGADAVIELAKVGSIVLQKSIPFEQ
eukprot:CAMPEP_0197277268 /NCGR_PEP_ID=MMETSP1432-20130617/16849_1 /TAXON_ID=44447 /ORGANISM="Pseudo-nitzschia delicatissima, Strain UNC1205" /LENGTH=231 /DNA_ID=CAMNT_0042743447 /DNA_START=102 /DNA_END=797 /DNA_ORIENTATION=-